MDQSDKRKFTNTLQNLFCRPNNGIIVGFAGEILTTTDGGSNWTIKTRGTTQALYGVTFTDLNTGSVVGLWNNSPNHGFRNYLG